MTDKEQVLSYLKAHGSISPLEALAEFGCYRLGARVFDLRRDGHSIETHIEHGIDRNGDPMRYARYTLKAEADDAQ